MLGFSLGGMAIMLAFTSAETFEIISEGGSDDSFFMVVIASFYHFILIQLMALIIAVYATANPSEIASLIGIFFFFYSLLSALATAGQILSTARIFNLASKK
jgi:hypothetical protein